MRLCVGEGQLHLAQHEGRSSRHSKGRVYSHLRCTAEATSGILHLSQMPLPERNVTQVARPRHRPLRGTGTRCSPGEAEGAVSVSLQKTRLIVLRGAQQKDAPGNRETLTENKEKNSHPRAC